MSPSTREMVINERAINRLKNIGEVYIAEGEAQAEAIKGATIAITSWGNTPIDEEQLKNAPDLKLVCHAAGSVKPIVSDALWQKGVRVTSSNAPLGMGVAETALGCSATEVECSFSYSAGVAETKTT